MESSDYIFGLHPVLEAIEAGKTIDRLYIKKDLHGDLALHLTQLARQYDVPVQRVPVEKLNRITRKNHQGVIAQLAAIDYHRLSDVVSGLYEDGIMPFVIVLDGLTDVRNFGAIARTAECCGVNAIVIPRRGSVSVGADAVKTSAGALLHIAVCREESLRDAVEYLKNSGYRIVAATEKAAASYTSGDYCSSPVAIVMGAEDTGISKEVLALCDTPVAIPMYGKIGSLNVSVAAGVMMYEVVRQRMCAPE